MRKRSSIRVIVVDDFHLMANALVDILESNFYDARAAYGAEEALVLAEEFKPHALIADMTLHGMDGLQLAMEFQRRHPECRILLMSAGYPRVPEYRNRVWVVPKASVRKEALRLLEICRESESC